MRPWFLLALAACNGPEVITDTDTPTRTSGSALLGESCMTTLDCVRNTTCSSGLVCATPGDPGTANFGESCTASADCEAGLVCDGEGTCNSVNAAGTAGVGEVCADDGDCQSGLACYQNTCAGLARPLHPGLECPQLGGTFAVEFDLSDGGDDFYQLPFPTDIRRGASGLDLAGHPTFTHPLLGDIGAAWLAEASELPAFGAGQVVFFRTSDLPAFDFAPGPLQNGAGVGAVDLTPGPTLGENHPVGWRFRSRQKYICDPWIAAFATPGIPWRSGHTYAVVVSTRVHGDDGGDPATPSSDLGLMLQETVPTGPELLGPWQAMAPFRDGFDTIPENEIASMATFTVGDTEAVGTALREASAGAVGPDLEVLHLCTDTPGPLGGTPGRGCHGSDPAFQELQGRLTVPRLQAGTAPFALPDQGGAADWSSGRPAIAGVETLEFSLTVPNAAMPAGGYPVVLFAHGEAGDYRAAITSGLAAEWADLSGAPFAVLTVDTWLTGPRSGSLDATWEGAFAGAHEPALLYANALNPAAARDNIAQSAIDWLTVLRWLETVDWADGSTSPTTEPIAFAMDEIHFVGEDIGSLAGPVFASYEPRIRGVVLANTGGSWMDVVSEARSPFPPSLLVGPAFADPVVDRLHPLLNIGQSIVDPVEPVNHGRFLHPNGSDRDVFILHGEGDDWVGPTSQNALSLASFTDQLVDAGAHALDGVSTVQAPVSGNRNGGLTAVTRMVVSATPHRLLAEDPGVRTQVGAFLRTAYVNGRATVP